MNKHLNIGVIGAGGFAQFAATAFLEVDDVNIIAVADVDKIAADKMATAFKAIAYKTEDDLLMNTDIDLIYIATPPYLHYEQSKKALMAGKHVICEKPAALRTLQARELQSLALAVDKLYVVNLMQRYNPLYEIVNKIIIQKLMGDFIHGFFENYASDENLSADHWFWKKEKSGGIFIEHGIHFFDMFSGWLGEGRVLNSFQLVRPEMPGTIDRVQATAIYNNALVNFYHGFDQPKILDRQELRLQFERGDITLFGWVPVKMKLHGIFQKKEWNTLKKLIGNFTIVKEIDHKDQKAKGRFNEFHFDKEIIIEYGNTDDKLMRYGQMLQSMLKDQWQWIQDKTHVRIIDDRNAVESLFMAEQATKFVQKVLPEKNETVF